MAAPAGAVFHSYKSVMTMYGSGHSAHAGCLFICTMNPCIDNGFPILYDWRK